MKFVQPFIALCTLAALSSCNRQSPETLVKPFSEGIFTHSINLNKYRFRGDTLSIYSGPKSDYINMADGKETHATAPILFIEVDNNNPFTFTANVSPAFSEVYDAGAMYVYVNDDCWQKLSFEMDERGMSRIVSVRTEKTSDNNNHTPVLQPNVYLKISSDTQSIGYYFSLDRKEWHLARLYRNNFPKKIKLGLSSQSPRGEGINTHFTDIKLESKAIKNFRMGI